MLTVIGLILRSLQMQNKYNKRVSVFMPLMLLLLFDTSGGMPLSDLRLLETKPPAEAKLIRTNEVSFMKINSNSWIIRNNPVSLSFGGLMYVYQRFVSPQLPSECLYIPSCSGFSRELIYDFGIFRGIILTSDRLMRCNRLAAMDVHPLLVDEKAGKVIESTQMYRTSCACGR